MKDFSNEKNNEKVRQIINQSPIFCLIKGESNLPYCKFSKKLISILISRNIPFESFNVKSLNQEVEEEKQLYETFKTFSNFPTFPQLYIYGELIGGVDICQSIDAGEELEEEVEEKLNYNFNLFIQNKLKEKQQLSNIKKNNQINELLNILNCNKTTNFNNNSTSSGITNSNDHTTTTITTTTTTTGNNTISDNSSNDNNNNNENKILIKIRYMNGKYQNIFIENYHLFKLQQLYNLIAERENYMKFDSNLKFPFVFNHVTEKKLLDAHYANKTIRDCFSTEYFESKFLATTTTTTNNSKIKIIPLGIIYPITRKNLNFNRKKFNLFQFIFNQFSNILKFIYYPFTNLYD
jgi:glutaredoxin-related protein